MPATELETKRHNSPDSWTATETITLGKGVKFERATAKSFYILGDSAYGINGALETISAGKIATAGPTQDNGNKPPDKSEAVAKLPGNSKPLIANHLAIKDEVIMQHKNKVGRPKKEGEVHRATEWRRKKKQEKQGLLL